MSSARIALRLSGVVTHTVTLPQTLAEGLADAERLARPFNVSRVRVIPQGFLFTLAPDGDSPRDFPGGELRDVREDFPAFLRAMEEVGLPPARALQFEGEPAIGLLVSLGRWLDHQAAADFERDIRAGAITFEEARDIRPAVFDVPHFQAFLAQCFKSNSMPKGRKGKRFTYSANVENLYALACRLYSDDPKLSLESACWAATEQRPDLVPPTWQAAPDETLKREALRIWDKSRWSQLGLRQRRTDNRD